EILRKAGIEKAKHVFLCLNGDSKALYITLLIRSINKEANIYAVVKHTKTEQLLREAGAKHVVSTKILGRTIASALFEPGVLTILTDIISAHGKGDLIQETITKKHIGKTIREIEKELNQKDKKYNYKIIAIIKPDKTYIIAPNPETKLEKQDTIILVKGQKT
ncbi:MAG: TrkA family potassium uptake protein, partial [Staphylothermus sp.]|nr:TrkA family potassium uptake protein [Staphylothermus sp.]